jgi:hypothetical protein
MRHGLDAREYKLLLNPAKFGATLSKASANTFWHRSIEPISHLCLNGRHLVESAFDRLIERNLRFWDTHDCTLAASDFALRTRVDLSNGQAASNQHEITLKLRMADYFVVADARLDRSDGDKRPEFEEDIAPLEVEPSDPNLTIALPAKPSIRSRYALTTKRYRHWENCSEDRLRRLFPNLSGLLRRPLGGDIQLLGGPRVHEFAAKGAKIRFDQDATGEFTLTLWQIGAMSDAPAVAEVSFKCDTPDGKMPGKAARRALELFNALQTELGDYVNTSHSSKTSLALPAGCVSG